MAIYKLAEHPDKVCGDILKALAKMVYGVKRREVGVGEQEEGGTVVENPDTQLSSQGMCARINIFRTYTFFLGKVAALGVLCCFALFVCLTLLTSFFLPSHHSLKRVFDNN